ncbi:MAG TPA: tripartite tricarboxylate transporter substrate binding protein [Burkholderiales bacterium]|nr:tripartite tricarboxylate transporter substrate binding protein [Burkholderiales bacterium]
MKRTGIGILLALTLVTAALAQTFPSRSMKLVVPYPPGAVTDILGRILGQLMGDSLGQPVIVDNRPGAGGGIGTEAIAKAAPDGYTFGLGASSTHVLNPLLYKPNYDPIKDFTPIGLIASTPLVLVVHPEMQVASLGELLAWIKARPGQTSYGSYGNASMAHLAGELLKSMTGLDMVHVPYKGSAPLQADVMARQLTMGISDMSAMPHVKSGKLKALALTAPKRVAAFPDIPVIAEEQGLAGFQATGWFALYGPAGLPAQVQERLVAALAAAVESPELRGRLTGLGLEMSPSTPDGLFALQRSEKAKWEKVIAEARIRVE